jgi:hypothetical protein
MPAGLLELPAKTIAPSLANSSATVNPMPRDAPVTSATFPLSLIFSLAVFDARQRRDDFHSSQRATEDIASSSLLREAGGETPPAYSPITRQEPQFTAGFGASMSGRHPSQPAFVALPETVIL